MIFRVQWGQKSPKNVFDHNLPWRNRVTISQPFQMETGIFPPQLSPEERNCFRIIGEYIFFHYRCSQHHSRADFPTWSAGFAFNSQISRFTHEYMSNELTCQNKPCQLSLAVNQYQNQDQPTPSIHHQAP